MVCSQSSKISFLIRRGDTDIQTHTHTEAAHHVMMEAGLKCCSYKPRNLTAGRQITARDKERFFPTGFRESSALPTP